MVWPCTWSLIRCFGVPSLGVDACHFVVLKPRVVYCRCTLPMADKLILNVAGRAVGALRKV